MSHALVERKAEPTDLATLAGTQITTAEELATRLQALQGRAFILSPMTAASALAPSHVINLVVVVIDPSVDAKSGRGADVYHQPSIHKTRKVGNDYEPVEVSLNKNGLLKLLAARGVNVYPTQRLDDGTRPFYYVMQAQGDALDFDGSIRRLPPGTVEIDLRDGSPQIGGWTPEEWAQREAVAAGKRAKLAEDQQWKAKPEAIGGWTAERVQQARKFGYRLAEAKALNALARNLGVRQSYPIEELRAKPFIFCRPSFVPDTSNPRVQEMLAATALGARNLLYPGAQIVALAGEAPSHHGDPGQVLDAVAEPEPEDMTTGAAPADAQEVDFDAKPATVAASAPAYHVTKVTQKGEWFFALTAEAVTFATPDRETARALQAAGKAGTSLAIESERVAIAGTTYRQVLELRPAGGMKL